MCAYITEEYYRSLNIDLWAVEWKMISCNWAFAKSSFFICKEKVHEASQNISGMMVEK